jgi:hypothetical protein
MKSNKINPECISDAARQIPVCRSYDVVVCGGGPAGVAAAISASRRHAKTLLIENNGCLGGIWTAGALSWIIDHENKRGLMPEIMQRLYSRGLGAIRADGVKTSCFDPEGMKNILDELCLEAGVDVRLYTRVCAAKLDDSRRITHVLTESKSGREAWSGKIFIDATGDGDLAAGAGCKFDMGRDEDRLTQPMSLMAILCGMSADEMRPFISDEGLPWGEPQAALRKEMLKFGHEPSYKHPTMFRIYDDLYLLMANHQYMVKGTDADDLTRATIEARTEIRKMTDGLRKLGGVWKNLRLVATGEQIGVREGRRIHGHYTLTKDDLVKGAKFPDAVCDVTFCVDVHSVNPKKDKGLSNGGIHSKPYQIPLRALIARDVEGLLLAGRCISGDFLAHASYRVTGNAVAIGEAAGACSALCSQQNCLPQVMVFHLNEFKGK